MRGSIWSNTWEVAALMAEAGLQDLRIAAVNGMSWAALGRRAADAGA
jgi:hypothetical protein